MRAGYRAHMEEIRGTTPVRFGRVAVLVAAAVGVLLLAMAPAGQAAEVLYFGHNASGASSGVSKIGADGAGLREDIAPGVPTPGVQEGIAATSTHVYFQVAIGMATTRPVYRASADGSGTPTEFFTPCQGNASFPNAQLALATDGQHLYYICRDNFTIHARIGRIGLDGSGRNDEFVNPGSFRVPTHLAANATDLYFATGTDIARASLAAPTSQTSILAGGNPNGIAVNSAHVYWTVGGGSPAIKRAGLDLSGPANVITGLTSPWGTAVTDAAIFWRRGSNNIAKASLGGTIENLSFVGASARGDIQSLTVAVAAPAPSPSAPATDTATTTTPPSPSAPTVRTSGLGARTMLKRTGPNLTTGVDCATTNGATLKACTVELVAQSSALKQSGKAKGKTTVIGRATRTSSTGAATIAVQVRVTSKAAKRILAAKGRLRVTVRITATSTADQAGTASRPTTLVVAKKKAAKAAFRR